jgi:prepilin-type processing-associated H-X9-DG protein
VNRVGFMNRFADASHFPRIGAWTRRETIVVLLLGVMLLIFLVPFFARRRATSAEAASTTNLLQWGIALNIHLIENENTFPRVGPATPDPTLAKAWYNSLPRYLSQKTFAEMTPDTFPQPGERSIWIDPAVKTKLPGQFLFHYGMNRHLQPILASESYQTYDLEQPASVVFLTEIESRDPGATPDSVVFRHGPYRSYALVLFCDGHVAPASRETLVDPIEMGSPDPNVRPVFWAPFRGARAPEQQ